MARKSSSSAVQEELYPLPRADEHDASERDARGREPFDDARLVDLETEQESPFLRGQKRVSVRRGSLPKKTANRLMWVGMALAAVAILAIAGFGLYSYGEHSWRFRIDSSDQIEVTGAERVPHAQIMEVMGGDIGRNIFFIPLSQRKQQLEQIPWVESASVMRFVPNRLRIEIHERTPVAFARIGSHISLIDAGGTLMELPPGAGSKRKYSFPVIAGMNSGEPLSTRAARMKNYNALVRDLDASGAHYSSELSEVDLGDPDDVKVLVADANGDVLVHLGSGNYLPRYKIYVAHVQQWRQQFDKLESVDLRYDGQIIVNPDLNGMPRQLTMTPAAAKAAMAAGVKPAAIVNYEKYVTRPASLVPAKKEVKPKGKFAAKPAAHLPAKASSAKFAVGKTPVKAAAARPAPAKQAVVNTGPGSHAAATQTTPKPQGPSTNVVASGTKTNASFHPAATASNSARVAATPGEKKPSAGIVKQAPQN